MAQYVKSPAAAENSLPKADSETPLTPEQVSDGERRVFMRRAALVGLPVVLATVKPRSVWAWGGRGGGGGTASCAASIRASKTCT